MRSGRKRKSSSQHSNKKQREEIEVWNPAVIVSQASTVTITKEIVNTNPNLLTPFPTQTYHHNTDSLSIKLNRLKEKSARYTLHKGFPSQCLNKKLNGKCLGLTLEPTIGNYDQRFIDNWYSKLKDFSLNLMEDVVSFRDKTIKETNTKMDQTEGILKQQLGKSECEDIQKTIKSNEASTKIRKV